MKAVALISVLFMLGCAAPIQNLTKTQYVNSSFNGEMLRSGGLALLPITAGQGQEGYRRPLGQYMDMEIPKALNYGNFLSWEVSMDSLNSHGLVDQYQQMMQNYQLTSIIDREKVKSLSSALGTRYAMLCALQDFSEKSNTSYNIFTGLSTTKTANVVAHCLVLDLQTGDVVQEIQGQAKSVAGDMMYNSGYDAYAQSVAKSVIAQLPKIQPAK